MLKKAFIANTFGLVAIMAAAPIGHAGDEAADSNAAEVVTPVKVLKVARGDFDWYGHFIGTVHAEKEIKLLAPNGGRVEEVLAQRGELVKPGQKLCDVDGKLAGIGLKVASLNEKIASDTYRRTKTHVSNGTSSRTKQQSDQLAWYRSQEAKIRAEKAEAGAFCRSPMTGKIVERFIEPYQELAPNAPTFHIADATKVRVLVAKAEDQTSGYQVGNPATLTRHASPGRTWHGSIRSLASSVDAKSRTITMELVFDNKDETLLPGASVKVKVLRKKLLGAIVVPNRAIHISGDDASVMVVRQDKATNVPVTMGVQLELGTQVVDGLKAGDQLIVVGSDLVQNGQKVRIVN